MTSGNVDIHARFVTALRRQPKTADALPPDTLPCGFCQNQGRIFQSLDQLFNHAKVEHASLLKSLDTSGARALVREEALKV
jgi:hypothetical protein